MSEASKSLQIRLTFMRILDATGAEFLSTNISVFFRLTSGLAPAAPRARSVGVLGVGDGLAADSDMLARMIWRAGSSPPYPTQQSAGVSAVRDAIVQAINITRSDSTSNRRPRQCTKAAPGYESPPMAGSMGGTIITTRMRGEAAVDMDARVSPLYKTARLASI